MSGRDGLRKECLMRKVVMELLKRGVVLTLMFAFGSANATTWYVDAATGSSSHSGKSMSDAFREIQTAVTVSSPCDTILVNDGIYSPITTRDKSITIKSVNGKLNTIIEGNNSSRCATLREGSGWSLDGKTNTVLIGFTLQNGYVNQNGGGVYGGWLRECTIRNCKVSDYGGGVCSVYLEKCEVEGNVNLNGQRGGGAWESCCVNCVFRGNRAQCGSAASQSSLFGCIVVGNIATTGGATHCGRTYNCVIVGNYAPKAAGVYSENPINCIIWKNYKTGTATVCNYESAGLKYCCSEPLYSGEGNICQDPCFVDEANGNYHLRQDSPCIDSAMTLQVLSQFQDITKDFDGMERLMGWGMDIGPYEYNQTQGRNINAPICWFVNKGLGNNLNNGRSKQSAFSDISKAVSIACEGDTVLVADGVYAPIETMNKSITIKSENGPQNTIIDANGGYSRCVYNVSYYSRETNVVVKGFTLRNSGHYGGVQGGTYENCIIRDNTSNWTGSYYAGGATSASLINCLIYNNRSLAGRGAGGVYDCWVKNCTIVGNSGAEYGGVSWPNSLHNSIVWENSGGKVNDFYSDWSDAGKRQYYNCCGNAIAGVGNIVANPRFVDSAHRDYRLTDASPCINSGTNGCVRGKYDFSGNPRIKGKTVDMGAFENQTAYPGAEVGYASARQRYPWNGLVDVQFDVFGMASNEVTNVVLSASGDMVKEIAMATFTQGDVSGLSNGTWHCVWDAGTDAPRVLDSNLVVRVALPDGDSCAAEATKLDTRSQPRDAAGSEDLLVSAAWQDEVPPENVTASLMQTQPGYKATKLAEFTGDAVQKVTWDAAGEVVPGVHLFTLTLKENDTGRVLKTMTSSFNVAGGGSEPQQLFSDDPLTIPLEFGSWSALGTFLNDSRAALLRVNGMTVVPPTANVMMISLGEFAVPLSMLSGTAEPVEAIEEYGVKVYHLHIREMGDGTSDLVATVGGVPVSLLSMPPYNPDRWVEALYGMPPTYLAGEERAKWYAERDVARIEWFMTLVPQSDIATYRANRAVAVSEAMKEQPEIGIGGLATKTDGETLHSVTVNVKEDSVVDVFGKRSLIETNWTYAGRAFISAGESAVGVVSDSLSYFMTVVRAGGTAEGGGAVVTEGDSDHDGIPDTVEKMSYGTNPHSTDTSGGGFPDWTKIYVYGLNPLVTDTDGDGYDDIEELMSGTDPKVPLPGANTSIRYYYDEDDQLIRVHCGATGAMSATELTPNGNPKTVKERRATK